MVNTRGRTVPDTSASSSTPLVLRISPNKLSDLVSNTDEDEDVEENAVENLSKAVNEGEDKDADTEAKPRARAKPHPLRYSELPSKGPNWHEGNHGIAVISSPIPHFRKPLALQYVNYNKHYTNYKFCTSTKDGDFYDRMIVAGQLAHLLLKHYVDPEHLEIVRLEAKVEAESILVDVPVKGSEYYLVKRKDPRPDENAVPIIFAAVTSSTFTKQPARKKPIQLQVNPLYLQSSGKMAVDGTKATETMRCSVVLLTGRTSPEKPSFEFYQFRADDKSDGTLHPWHGQLQDTEPIAGTNLFSLGTDQAEMVDRMFKAVIRCSMEGNLAVTPN